MKILGISHIIEKENPEGLLKKIKESLEENPDLIIGPDYALGEYLSKESLIKKEILIKNLKEISKNKSVLIFPGSMSYGDFNKNEMLHSVPAVYNGKIISEFFKERDNGEAKNAEKAGLKYKKGNANLNKIEYKNKKISIEICGDHGMQDVYGCDIELILAYDNRGGFYINAKNDNFSRKAVLNNGYNGDVCAFDFNPYRTKKLKQIKGQNTKYGKIFIL